MCCQPAQAKLDMQRLKMQRQEKKLNQDTKLQLTKGRDDKNHTEEMFLHAKFQSTARWKNPQDTEEGLKTHKWQNKSIISLEEHDKYLH